VKKRPDPRQLSFDFLSDFDDNYCSQVHQKNPCRWWYNDMGARTLGLVRPNEVIASPILPDPPLWGKGLSMSTAIILASSVVPFVVPPASIAPPPVVKTTDPDEARRQRGLAIAAVTRITRQKDGLWLVPSQTGVGSYRVNPTVPTCTCKDFVGREQACKHVMAVRFVIERESHPDAPETESLPATLAIGRKATTAPRRTYKQDWPQYNAAQINEKAKFLILMHDLCRGIPEPPPKHRKGGRPPVLLADRAFACALKVYTTISGRRASTDMREARDKGHLGRAPHYSAIYRFLEDPEMTPILKRLIIESSKPLASVEVDFAGDSSGFTTCRFEPWYDHKYGVIRRKHGWVKVHIMTGVKTNIVTAVEIKDKDAQDAPQLPSLVEVTSQNFTMCEVSLDKVYASLDNYAAIDRAGAVPYIPFKSNHTGAGGGLWAKMFHFFNFHRDEFNGTYHKRSNVESTFSMIKAKFGDCVRSKTETAQVNEALCKVLCHNVCCLISAAYELGIAATFWGQDEAEAVEVLEAEGADEMVEAMAWM
jgi:transposase